MIIGILGAGFVGGTLAKKLAAAGHQVRLANSKDPVTLVEFDGIDGIAPAWAADAVDGVEVAVVALPLRVVGTLPEDVLSALRSAQVVIDTANYYPVRDGRIAPLDEGMADSEWVAWQLGRPVQKVFNNIGAPSLKYGSSGQPEDRLALTVAGPAGAGKDMVLALVDELGFAPLDAGDLDASWRLQPGTPTYCKNMKLEEMRAALGETVREHVGKYREERDKMQDFEGAMQQMKQQM